MSALFLDPKGKIIFDSIISKIPKFDPKNPIFYIDTNISHSSLLEAHIQNYSFRKQISINNLTNSLEIHATYSEYMIPEISEGSAQEWTDFDVPLEIPDEENIINLHGYTAFIDPRTKYLGSRTISGVDSLEIDNEIVQKPVSFYHNFRRLCGVCEGPSMVGQIPHVLNLHELNAISFTKGCYVGQELIARTQTQGVLRTITLPFIISTSFEKFDEAIYVPISMVDEKYEKTHNSEKISDDQGNFIGQVIESDKNIGIAKVKIDSSGNYAFLPDKSRVFFWKPSWISKITSK